MGSKIDPRDFLLNTDYEMDKIIFYKELKYTVSTHTEISVPHNLKVLPLVFGIWSYNADYTDAHEIGGPVDSTNSPPCLISSTATTLEITLNPRNSNTTFYIRVFGFESNYNGVSHAKLATTSKYAKNFILNTDYNYLKLLKSGNFLDYSSGTTKYTHNLGYAPYVMDWAIFENNYTPVSGFSYIRQPDYTYTSGLFVTDKVIEYYEGLLLMHHETRLYADET